MTNDKDGVRQLATLSDLERANRVVELKGAIRLALALLQQALDGMDDMSAAEVEALASGLGVEVPNE